MQQETSFMKFLVTGYLPTDFDPSTVTEEMGRKIHDFNAEMEAAGVLFFAGGLAPANQAKTLQSDSDGEIFIKDGPYVETKEIIGGFYILDAADMDEALSWGRRAAGASLGPIEMRQIFFVED
jgi:hypothetical protein